MMKVKISSTHDNMHSSDVNYTLNLSQNNELNA